MTRAIAVLVLLVPALAHAQSSEADAQFKRGKVLMAEGKTAEACAAFDASQAAEENVSVKLNQANCREKNGQLATALKHFNVAVAQTTGATDKLSTQLRKVAVERAKKLEGRVSKLTLEVAPGNLVAGLTIKRGNDIIDQAGWNTAVAIDGGTYTIEVSAPDYEPWSTTVTIAIENDRKAVAVPALTRKPVPVVVVNPEPKPDEKPDVRPDDKPDAAPTTKPTRDADVGRRDDMPAPRRSRTGLYIAVGGAVLLGVGLGFELWSQSVYDDAVAEGNDNDQRDKWKDAIAKRNIGTISMLGGGVAVGVGLIWWLRSGSSAPARTARFQLAPSVTSEQAGVVVGGQF